MYKKRWSGLYIIMKKAVKEINIVQWKSTGDQWEVLIDIKKDVDVYSC